MQVMIVEPSVVLEHIRSREEIYQNIERAGRTCYKSEDKITEESAEKFCRMIIKRGHESVLEHESATVRFICDRGVSHELVRHRLASFSQESTRYCVYKDAMEVIMPSLSNFPDVLHVYWMDAMQMCANTYDQLLASGVSAQIARSVLPTALKTEVVMTANLREWRHIFRLRCSSAAHPQIQTLMLKLVLRFHEHVPALFDDIMELLGLRKIEN